VTKADKQVEGMLPMTVGVRTGKAQNERMFFRFAPESGPTR